MPRFNFNNISLQSKADISKIMENFNIIEENARTATEIQELIDESAAPITHNSDTDAYGLGTTGLYGHCKVINNLTAAAFANGEALSAFQGKKLKDSIDELDNSLGELATTNYSKGTSAPSGGSNGDIYDQYFN